MKLKILVEVDIEPDDKDLSLSSQDLENSAVEAVNNAVKMAEDLGFNHDLSDEVSISVMSVELLK